MPAFGKYRTPIGKSHKLGRSSANPWCKPNGMSKETVGRNTQTSSNIIKIKWVRLKMDIPKRASLIGKMMESEVLNSKPMVFVFSSRPSRRISSSDDQVPIRHLTFTTCFVLPCVRALRQRTSPFLDLFRFLSPAFLWPVLYMKRPSFTSSTCCKMSIKKW